MRTIKKISLDLPELKDVIANGKFYDAAPPMIHILILLHDYIFPSLISSDKYDKSKKGSKLELKATTKQLRDELQKRFFIQDDHQEHYSIPNLNWVREAVKKLVELKLAFIVEKKKDLYTFVLQKPTSEDSIEYFTRLIEDKENSSKKKKLNRNGQQDLFKSNAS